MSLKRFLGWEPSETHTATHPDGSVVVTVVEREAEWDDTARADAYAFWQAERERCTDCGQPMDECSDPDADYYPQRRVCWATAAREVANRRWHKINEGAKPDGAGYMPDDGVALWVSRYDLTPDDWFI